VVDEQHFINHTDDTYGNSYKPRCAGLSTRPEQSSQVITAAGEKDTLAGAV